MSEEEIQYERAQDPTVCTRCGARVDRWYTDVHLDWHNRLNEVANDILGLIDTLANTVYGPVTKPGEIEQPSEVKHL